MGQVLSNILICLCGDPAKDEFQGPIDEASPLLISPPSPSPIPELHQIPPSSSTGSDSVITNSVSNPSPGADLVEDSASPSSESTSDESDSVSPLGRDLVIILPKWLEEFLRDSSITVGADTSEVLKEVRERDEERETFTSPCPSPIPELLQIPPSSSTRSDSVITNSVSNPSPGEDSIEDSASPSSESTSGESDSVSPLGRDLVIILPKWLEEFLRDSSITVGADTSEVLKEVRERDEERETFTSPCPSPIPELLQIPPSSSTRSDSVITNSVSNPSPGEDSIEDSASPSSESTSGESDSVSPLGRDLVIILPKWLEEFLRDSSITVGADTSEVLKEVRERDEERETFTSPCPSPIPELLQIPPSSSTRSDSVITNSVSNPSPGEDSIEDSASPSSESTSGESDSVSPLGRDLVIILPKWLEEFLRDSSITVGADTSEVLKEVRERDEERETFTSPCPSPIPELLQIPPSSSTRSDSVITNSVSNPSPGEDSIEDSASPSSESTSGESDSVSPLGRDLVIILPKWLEEFLRDSSITVGADTSEVLKEVRERDEERETFTSPCPSPIPELLQIPPSSSTRSDSVITNSVSNPSPGEDSIEDSASPSSESTSGESDSVSPLGRDLVIILPKWLEEFLRDSSITVGADTSEVLKEVRERDEERETFTSPCPSPIPELLQIPPSSSTRSDSVITNSVSNPSPGEDSIEDSASPSSESTSGESDSVSPLGRDLVIILPKWLEEFLRDSSITVGADTSEVLKEVRERDEERETFTSPCPSPIPELLQIPPSSSTRSDSVITNSVSNPSPGEDSIEDSASPSSESTSGESDSVSPLGRDLVIILPKWLEEFLRDSSITVGADTSEVLKEVRERDEERETFTSPCPSPIPELLQIPPSSSTRSDSVITNSVSNPSPGEDSIEDSASPSSESTSGESDSVSPLGRDLVIILPKWLEEFLRDSSITVGADTSEVLKEVRERDEERETFTSPCPSPIPELLQIPPSSSTRSDSVITNSVSNPSPGEDSIEDSASPSSESTSGESDSVSPLGRDLVIILPKWLEEFLRDSSITVGADTSEVLKEVRERDEERETFTSPCPSPIPELLQIPPSSSTRSDSVITNSVSNPSPGEDSIEDSASPSSESTSGESDSVSPLGRDLVIILPKWLEEFLRDSSITVGADTSEESEVSEVLKEVRERDEERETFTSPSPELLQIPLSSCYGLDSFADSVTNSVPIPPPGSDPVPDSTSPSSEAKTLPKWLDVFLVDSSITVLEEKKEVVREVLREERERVEERGGGAKVGRVERWMKHYSSFQKILLVGEGDFSFSACLAMAFGCAHNIIATSLDSRGFLSSNYRKAMSNIESLTSRGAEVVHGVDATQMANHFLFRDMTFDRIVFNFPHAGFDSDESRELHLRRQRKLIRLFMKNAKKMIGKRGEIHVSHKSNAFFREWNLEQLATNEGLRLIESSRFNFTDYPGYHTKYGYRGDKNFNCNPSKNYKFGLKF
ncbi:Heavy metal-associated isoprenylated plant protein [Actinidia chinensis var. chinensis]|uniref:Heavy metal-associated isoprenylated plant protein n=1 Tax=Actinidia chinensis var. chinensis TaxID=1590841 RepID=A0A2R6QD16_ACTCC|nr:Heavy metal-associated isoprenylated plant protein [Actinidia chinensis var. chinensis]